MGCLPDAGPLARCLVCVCVCVGLPASLSLRVWWCLAVGACLCVCAPWCLALCLGSAESGGSLEAAPAEVENKGQKECAVLSSPFLGNIISSSQLRSELVGRLRAPTCSMRRHRSGCSAARMRRAAACGVAVRVDGESGIDREDGSASGLTRLTQTQLTN